MSRTVAMRANFTDLARLGIRANYLRAILYTLKPACYAFRQTTKPAGMHEFVMEEEFPKAGRRVALIANTF